MRILFAIGVLLSVSSPALAQGVTPDVAPVGTLPAASQAALPGAPRAAKAEGAGQVSRNAPINGVLTLFGNERCPTDAGGNEIVVCVRRSAEEQYRVPKELREFQITPQNEAWAVKAQGTTDAGVGVNSIGSCSTVGAGGATGCFQQRVREARKDNAQRNAEKTLEP